MLVVRCPGRFGEEEMLQAIQEMRKGAPRQANLDMADFEDK